MSTISATDSATDSVNALADILSVAYNGNTTISVPAALEPENSDRAYAVQQRILKNCHVSIGGWKIGAKSDIGPIQGAPLPQLRIYAASASTPVSIARKDYPVLGLELEIFFSFNRDFLPQSEPIPEQEVLESISGFGASIEIVSSRVNGWRDAPKLVQLADLQNHGALMIGQMVAYRGDFSTLNPVVDLRLDGVPLFSGVGQNPAGDPRRLLSWLVNHCSQKGLGLLAGTIITTGSYTGVDFPTKGGTVAGEIAGLPAVTFELI
ncbi:2-keto-4-pentenoate hydratase [Glaciimonas sp. Gout2]|uniref:fumarylacetoacetate hydrolase family protein n=1 Tax=unclassified Glaciimonas TaxID=2644401 RepID=UPI002B23D903|nr:MULTISPECIES: fumarylacetoacetate hydrolase family protein [unclassified Glaciimonas]MEB0011684.1 2-keto-4-pentenoate hydratase [Glaciimonas sp. Cout2]MEB0080760.1 2-keto-4-pentenoate hydratase [Glaciimonas sp. Gout2]